MFKQSAAAADQELSILTEIGHILSSTLELRESFRKMMQIISDKLDMRAGRWSCSMNPRADCAQKRQSD